jgi:hypothetical protein
MAREVFTSDELTVRALALVDGGPDYWPGKRGAFPVHQPHLNLTPTQGIYARLTRADAERLHAALGEWLAR